MRTRLEHSLSSGGCAISSMSGSTKPGREAATPMVTRLVLWCTYTGAPRLVTWGVQGERLGPLGSLTLLWLPHSEPPTPVKPPSCLLPAESPSPGRGVSRPSCPSSARGAQRPGDLDEVTLEHGQRAEGQVLPLLEGLLQLAQSGDPLRGAPERLRTPHVPEPVHGRCRKDGSPGGAEAGTRHPDAWLPRPPSQPTGPSPSDFSCSSGWSFPRARAWPSRGGPRRRGEEPSSGLCDLMDHRCGAPWELPRDSGLPSPPPGTLPRSRKGWGG